MAKNKEFEQVNDSTKDRTEAGLTDASELVGELTPISIKEAAKVVDGSLQYESDEAIARAILDFTAIARAFFRTIPKYKSLEYNNR